MIDIHSRCDQHDVATGRVKLNEDQFRELFASLNGDEASGGDRADAVIKKISGRYREASDKVEALKAMVVEAEATCAAIRTLELRASGDAHVLHVDDDDDEECEECGAEL